MKIESRGLFASMKANKTMAFLVVALVAFFAATIFSQIVVQKNNSRDQGFLKMTADLEKQAYRITSLSRDATAGDETAFTALNGVITSMDETWDKLRQDDDLRDALYDEKTLGKPVGQDDLHGRPNAVTELGVEGAIDRMRNILGGAIASIPKCEGEANLARMVTAQAKALIPSSKANSHHDRITGK